METTRTTEAAVAVARSSQTVLWVIAVLLAIIATVLIVRPADPMVLTPAYADQPMAGANGVFAFTGQLDKNRYGLFMMDVGTSNLWCYEYMPSTRRLKLVAARSFRSDRYLENYQNDEPTPGTVQMMLKEEDRIQDRDGHGATAPANDEEKALETSIPDMPK